MSDRGRVILIGGLIGAATGIFAAILLNRRVERGLRTTAITSGEGLRLGILLFGLLRAVASLGDED